MTKYAEKFRMPPGPARVPVKEAEPAHQEPQEQQDEPTPALEREPLATDVTKQRPSYFDDDDVRITSVDDPRWATWALPFVAFLWSPREWNDIFRFGAGIGYGQNFTRQVIAWLSFNSLADPSKDQPTTWKMRGETGPAVE